MQTFFVDTDYKSFIFLLNGTKKSVLLEHDPNKKHDDLLVVNEIDRGKKTNRSITCRITSIDYIEKDGLDIIKLSTMTKEGF